MNLAKFQDTKSMNRNHLHSYILTMKNQKQKLRNQSIHNCKKKSIRYLGINVPKETNSSRDGNTTPPYLPPEKYVCRSRSNS